MEQFTGWQYLLIDLANLWGMDKELFGTRIEWAEANLPHLEQLYHDRVTREIADKVPNHKRWKEAPGFYKTMLAIRKAQQGIPTGHLVEFDACNSGMQVMSALTGCAVGANNTGLVDPNVRADAYGRLTMTMQGILGEAFNVSRGDAKQALMTVLYGSRDEPKAIFGEDTPELKAFYQAVIALAPGAWELLQDLLASWKPTALVHEWKLPDGFDARVKVMQKKTARIEVDELDHATFTYEFYVNEASEYGVANAANVVHSVDAYVLRCVHRRCNYDRQMVERAIELLGNELHNRDLVEYQDDLREGKLAYYVKQYQRSGMADAVILPHVTANNVAQLSTKHLCALVSIGETMLAHKPFPVIAIHDAFRCHPNNMNHLRQHYVNILAEISESHLLADLMSQLYGRQCPNVKLSQNLGQLIRQSNYSLS